MKKVKIIFITIGALVGLLFLFFLALEFGVMRTNLWLKLPKYWKTQVAFTKLEQLSSRDNCHEDCIIPENLYETLIGEYMSENPDVLDEQFERYINDPEVDLNMKSNLVEIAKRVEEEKKKEDPNYQMETPGYLLKYLANKNNNPDLRADILSVFHEQIGASPWLITDFTRVIKNTNKSIDDRIPAIKDLGNLINKEEGENVFGVRVPKYGNVNYREICEMFLDIVEDSKLENEEENNQLRFASLYGMNFCLGYEGVYTEDFFVRFKNIFNNRENHLGIRDETLAKISLYYNIDNSKSRAFLDRVYNNKNEHIYLKFSAWMSLTDKNIEGYLEPGIDYDEFDEYSSEAIFELSYTRKSYQE